MVETLAALGSIVDPNALAYRSSLLPLGRTNAGDLTWAVPQAVLSALGAVQYPGQVYRGEASVYDPTTGHVSEEAIRKANDIAGLAQLGTSAVPAPKGALRVFGGWNAETADHAALASAQNLKRSGADRQAIWDRTGWFQGVDGKWRFEIPDDLATIGSPKNAPPGYGQLYHDDLAAAYPEMWSGTQQSIREAPAAAGRYEQHGANDGVIFAEGPTAEIQRSVALHELQHPIQAYEGFGRGANPRQFTASDWEAAGSPALSGQSFAKAHEDWAWNQYHRTSGEVEARNVQARMNMTPEQRRATPPWLTQDVPDEMQIVRFAQTGLPSFSAPLPETPLSRLGR